MPAKTTKKAATKKTAPKPTMSSFAVLGVPAELAPSVLEIAKSIKASEAQKSFGIVPIEGGINGTKCKYKVSSIFDRDFDFNCEDGNA